MATQSPEPGGVLAALERITGSEAFRRTARHRNLLRYLVEKSVGGRADEIKEFTIALEVFGRESYDPQADSQVRVEVGKLRERLERYYATEGLNEPIRIVIPKGSYQPVFEQVVQEAAPGATITTTSRPKRVMALWTIAALLLAGIITGLVWDRLGQAPIPDKPSLVVLPFEDLSPAKDQEYFCSGIAEELTSTLSAMQIFRVLPRSYGATYAGRPADARKVGAELKVHAVVEGAVRKEGSNVRITVRLVDARGGGQLWSATYNRELGRVLETQQEIAESVARSFNVDLPDTRHALVRQRTRNAEAYDHYLRAAYLYTNEVDRSVEYYKAAVAADPGYALAWAGLAAAWVRLTDWYMVSVEKARQSALPAAEKAIALDPTLRRHNTSGAPPSCITTATGAPQSKRSSGRSNSIRCTANTGGSTRG